MAKGKGKKKAKKKKKGTEVKVLLVEDDPLFQTAMVDLLAENYEVKVAGDGAETREVLSDFVPDLVLMDINLPDVSGVDLLAEVVDQHPSLPVIMLSAVDKVATVVECTKRGAYDYLTKPVDEDELEHRIGRALEASALQNEVHRNRLIQREANKKHQIIGGSSVLTKILKSMEKVGPTDANVLILGETGTGKELMARGFHRHSKRADGPFIAVNCGAVPGELIESEFFGHVKGAFTSAHEDRLGKFQLAHGGTIFLDELGELPKEAQVKLLRVLEERTFFPVGGQKEVEVDVRVVAATNVNLEEKVEGGDFREDLFYRLNVFSVPVPPLRERKEDIMPLVLHFLATFNQKFGKDFTGVTDGAVEILENCRWKGNIRELRNAVERVAISEDGPEVEKEHLSFLSPTVAGSQASLTLSDEGLDATLEVVEKDLILKVLAATGGNKTQTAKKLKISVPTLYYRLEKHDIS